MAPELQRTIERVQHIVDRTTANFVCEAAINGLETKDRQADFRPYRPSLYPNARQVRELPGEKAIALIRFYDSLNEIETLVDDWWEREGQLAVNIFNVILHAAEKSLRLSLDCIREFDLKARFPPPYESWGTLTLRLERSFGGATKARLAHLERAEARRLDPLKSKEPTPFCQY